MERSRRRQRQQRQRPAARGRPPGQVWDVDDWQGGANGFYVSERRNLDAPIAYVDTATGSCTTAAALARAKAIAADPAVLDGPDDPDVPVVDLRRCGRTDSPDPVPGWVFGLVCRPLNCPNTAAREPRPFCRWMLYTLCDAAGYALIRAIGSTPFRPADGYDMRQPRGAKEAAPDKPSDPIPAKVEDRKGERPAAA